MGKKLTTKQWIEKARAAHGDKYDYSKVNYLNARSKVTIICSKHGDFVQSARSHLSGSGCPVCGKESADSKQEKSTKEDFIEKAKSVHGDKYDYSNTEYINIRANVLINCSKHGDFQQRAGNHLMGSGCAKCFDYQKSTTKEWIKKAKLVHGDRYDYSKSDYVGALINLTIICSKHGDFVQSASNHLSGRGCAKCNFENATLSTILIPDQPAVNAGNFDW